MSRIETLSADLSYKSATGVLVIPTTLRLDSVVGTSRCYEMNPSLQLRITQGYI